MKDFQTIAQEMIAYADAHPLNVMNLEGPTKESYRHIVVNGHLFRLCFTYQVTGDIKLHLLSIYDGETWGKVPDKATSKEIAETFFPNGFVAVDGDLADLDASKISRKYMSKDWHVPK